MAAGATVSGYESARVESPEGLDTISALTELSERHAGAYQIAELLVALPGGGVKNHGEHLSETAAASDRVEAYGVHFSPWIVTNSEENPGLNSDGETDTIMQRFSQVQIMWERQPNQTIETRWVVIVEAARPQEYVTNNNGFTQAELLWHDMRRVPKGDQYGLEATFLRDRVIHDEALYAASSAESFIGKFNPVAALNRWFEQRYLQPKVEALEAKVAELLAAAGDIDRNRVLAQYLNSLKTAPAA